MQYAQYFRLFSACEQHVLTQFKEENSFCTYGENICEKEGGT